MIAIDFETTGLLKGDTDDPKRQPGICQIGLVILNSDWTVVGEYETLVNPEMAIEPGAAAAHGITDAMLRGAPTFAEAFWDLIGFARSRRYWVGYNNEFDRKVLYHQLRRYGLEMKYPWPCSDIDVMKVGGDLMQMQGKRGAKFPKLIELHQALFGEAFGGAHNALKDIKATVRCGRELKERGLL
jgi:DNA polymerase III epsilon subunit-like protein